MRKCVRHVIYQSTKLQFMVTTALYHLVVSGLVRFLIHYGTTVVLFIIPLKNHGKFCLVLLFIFIKNKNIMTGTPAMTTRGCVENDFETIADFLLRAAKIASNVVKEHGKIQKDFSRGLQNNNDIIELRNQVEAFASQFALPAFDV